MLFPSHPTPWHVAEEESDSSLVFQSCLWWRDEIVLDGHHELSGIFLFACLERIYQRPQTCSLRKKPGLPAWGLPKTAGFLPHKFFTMIVWECLRREQDEQLVCGKSGFHIRERHPLNQQWDKYLGTYFIDRWGGLLSHYHWIEACLTEVFQYQRLNQPWHHPFIVIGTWVPALTHKSREILALDLFPKASY